MSVHLQREIEKLKKEILFLGAMVEDRFQQSVHAVKSGDPTLAQRIMDTGFEIDRREIEIEEECLKVLALHQPVATDLRFIVAVIKINNDLERIADYASNIAKRFIISSHDPRIFKYDYAPMADQAAKMLRKSLDALVHMDVDLAYTVRDMDAVVNAMRNEAYEIMKKDIKDHPRMVGEIINMYLISRHLERIGDHTKNIAEEVIYLIEGEIVRHQGKR